MKSINDLITQFRFRILIFFITLFTYSLYVLWFITTHANKTLRPVFNIMFLNFSQISLSSSVNIS